MSTGGVSQVARVPSPGPDGLLLDLVTTLREVGVPVGSGELLDASEALRVIPWEREELVREALAATLTKSADHRERFLVVWDEVLRRAALQAALEAQRRTDPHGTDGDRQAGASDGSGEQGQGGEGQGEGDGKGSGSGGGRGAGTTFDVDELARMVQEALAGSGAGDAALRDLARLAIEAARQNESGVVGVDVQRIRRLLGVNRGADTAAGLADSEVRRFTELLRRELEEQRTLRSGQLPQPRAVAELGRDLSAGTAPDQGAVLKAVQALRRELAVAGHRRRGPRNGPIDLRRTMRASLQTGGVPVDVLPQRRHPKRPQMIALCDVSTSVSASSVFFLSVITALTDSFSRLRAWAFVERADEVTDLCLQANDPRELGRAISRDAKVTDATGYTDYGRVMRQLAVELEGVIDRRTTLLVLGDARTNGRDPGVDAFAAMASQAHRTLWLNPEPELYWNYGDSESARYMEWCEMHRCASPADLIGLAKLLAAP